MKYFFAALSIALCLASSIPTLVFAAPANKGTTTELVNPIGGSIKGGNKTGEINIKNIVGLAIKYTLGIMGSLAFAAFVYGGFMWLTSGGESSKVSTGTNAMLYASIGLFIIFGAYAILNTIISGIAK